jgi:hypothetical protein
MELYDELDIVTEVKRMRLRLLGHMERMSDDRSTKELCSKRTRRLKTGGKAEEALVRRSRAGLDTDGSERLEKTSLE